jgi:hypothetical protein
VEYRAPVVTPWWYDFLALLIISGLFLVVMVLHDASRRRALPGDVIG